MVIADIDGVVIVPFAEIDSVINALQKVQKLETALDARVADGLITHDKIASLIEKGQIEITDD